MSTQQPGQTGPPSPPPGPPYLPQVAPLGGIPAPVPDDIISAILLALFVAGAAIHMSIFQINRRREHKFIFSVLLFGFCMARIAALVMRIVLASRPGNINIGIAANIFVAAGVLLLFIVNLLFAQRIVRAYHPKFGWHAIVTWGFRFLFFSVIALLVMVITTTVHSFFTLDMAVHQKERDVALFAGTYLAVLAFLPIPIVILSVLFPRADGSNIDKFGAGRLRTKVRLLLFTSTLLSLGAGFRIGVNFSPRPLNNPAWYHSKAAFYCFNFVIELIVVYVYAIARFDKRFHVPDGSSARGHYKGTGFRPGGAVNTESEVFGGDDGENKGSTGEREAETEAEAEPEQEPKSKAGEQTGEGSHRPSEGAGKQESGHEVGAQAGEGNGDSAKDVEVGNPELEAVRDVGSRSSAEKPTVPIEHV